MVIQMTLSLLIQMTLSLTLLEKYDGGHLKEEKHGFHGLITSIISGSLFVDKGHWIGSMEKNPAKSPGKLTGTRTVTVSN